MIAFRVDGQAVEVVDDGTSLLEVLRDRLGIRSPKDGCSPQGQCGCCTVLIDGKSGRSCLTLVAQAHGAEVTTIEALAAEDGGLHAIQQAFKECHALQCGFCTPGMIMNILGRFNEPQALDLTDDGIRTMLSGNLCRCTGYVNIIAAVRRAAQLAGRA